jgi:multidrug efflux system membrane fusion protein
MKRVIFPALLLLAGCGHKETAAPQNAPQQAAHSVTTVAAAVVEVPVVREAAGTVRARTSASVSSRIMAYVREVRVQQGDSVRAGQLLLTLDPKELDSAQRQVEEGQREARSMEAEVTGAIAAAKAQLDLAQTTFRRMSDLFQKRSISNQEFDEAQAKVRLAEANFEMAQAKRAQLEARIAQAAEAVKSASIMRDYTQITAPFAGVISEKRVEPGNLATPGASLLMIEQAGSFRLEVPVDESLLTTLKRGQRIEVQMEALDRSVMAPIAEIVPVVDASTRSITVKLDLPALGNLRSGMSGRARFADGVTKALVTPITAVRSEGSLQTLFVADGGVARNRMVTLGNRRADMVEILSGLSEGERVITTLPSTLHDGDRVEVRP